MTFLGGELGSLKESFIALVLSALAAVFAGLFLGRYDEFLLLIPGLIMLIPGSTNMRGAIFAALGSRLGSSMHLGTIDKLTLRSTALRNNIYSSITLNLSLSLTLGIIAWALSRALGFGSVSVFHFIFISVIGSVIAAAALLAVMIFIMFRAYARGWDPDNIHAPLITSIGDFVTIPAIMLAAFLSLSLSIVVLEVVTYIAVLAIVADIGSMVVRKKAVRMIVIESFPIILLSGILSTLAGTFIEPHLLRFAALPGLLVLVPALLGMGGNIGNIFASRVATKFHLGTLTFNLRGLKSEIQRTYLLSIVIYPLIGIINYIFSRAVGLETVGFFIDVFLATFIGIAVTTLVIIFAFIMGVLSYKFNWDPDNTLNPTVTGIADFFGLLTFITVLIVFGIV